MEDQEQEKMVMLQVGLVDTIQGDQEVTIQAEAKYLVEEVQESQENRQLDLVEVKKG